MKIHFYKTIIIPKQLSVFINRALAFFLCWVFLYYLNKTIPIILNETLTLLISRLSLMILNVYNEGYALGEYSISNAALKFNLSGGSVVLYLNEIPQIGIADSCNGLELYVLYAGFIVSWRQNILNKSIYIIGGLSVLLIINVLRIVALAWVHVKFPHYFDFIHHYLFTTSMYLGIFGIWYWFTNLKHETN